MIIQSSKTKLLYENDNLSSLENNDKHVGNKVSDFRIISELGRGSYGVVNRVESLMDHKEYVMKKINIKHVKQKHQKEALKEAQILRKVRHPNIISYYTSFVENDHLYIIMEYAEGGDLQMLIKKHKEGRKLFSEKEIWGFAWELCSAVDYLHSNNIIHRDIKTLNIFLTKDKIIKLGDLGVSKIVSSAASFQGTRVGTPLYLSPELIKQLPYDHKVDIWAIGCVLYQLASLELPFNGDNLISLGYNIVHKNPKNISPQYTPQLSAVILKFLEKNPKNRPKLSEILETFPQKYKPDQKSLHESKIFGNISANQPKREEDMKKSNNFMVKVLKVNAKTETSPKPCTSNNRQSDSQTDISISKNDNKEDSLVNDKLPKDTQKINIFDELKSNKIDQSKNSTSNKVASGGGTQDDTNEIAKHSFHSPRQLKIPLSQFCKAQQTPENDSGIENKGRALIQEQGFVNHPQQGFRTENGNSGKKAHTEAKVVQQDELTNRKSFIKCNQFIPGESLMNNQNDDSKKVNNPLGEVAKTEESVAKSETITDESTGNTISKVKVIKPDLPIKKDQNKIETSMQNFQSPMQNVSSPMQNLPSPMPNLPSPHENNQEIKIKGPGVRHLNEAGFSRPSSSSVYKRIDQEPLIKSSGLRLNLANSAKFSALIALRNNKPDLKLQQLQQFQQQQHNDIKIRPLSAQVSHRRQEITRDFRADGQHKEAVDNVLETSAGASAMRNSLNDIKIRKENERPKSAITARHPINRALIVDSSNPNTNTNLNSLESNMANLKLGNILKMGPNFMYPPQSEMNLGLINPGEKANVENSMSKRAKNEVKAENLEFKLAYKSPTESDYHFINQGILLPNTQQNFIRKNQFIPKENNYMNNMPKIIEEKKPSTSLNQLSIHNQVLGTSGGISSVSSSSNNNHNKADIVGVYLNQVHNENQLMAKSKIINPSNRPLTSEGGIRKRLTIKDLDMQD